MTPASNDVDLDLIEQCRAGDRTAFRALVAFWGEPVLRVASLLTHDVPRAKEALADGLLECWRQLPSTHSETPFRPLLIGLVAHAAIARGAGGGTGRFGSCLDALDAEARAAAIMSSYARLKTSEIALAQGTTAVEASRRVRRAFRALHRCLGYDARATISSRRVEAHLDGRFFDDEVAAGLADQWLLEVRRLVARPVHDAWAVLNDPTALPAWTSAERSRIRGGGALRVGAHIASRGRIADMRPSYDETVITRAEHPTVLTWTTRSRLVPLSGTIEFRWSILIEDAPGGCELRHRLHGVAFPQGPFSGLLRGAYDKVSESMRTSMHRGLERLASLVDASTG
jgi:DNA-directed RNA polymerase specialized sigma24 family protein/uncharacterized protein YndB with AHSA1/START domain